MLPLAEAQALALECLVARNVGVVSFHSSFGGVVAALVETSDSSSEHPSIPADFLSRSTNNNRRERNALRLRPEPGLAAL